MEEEKRENGQWPDLPLDFLLLLFERHLPGRIGSLRLNSVCSPWRSSALHPPPRFPPRLCSTGHYYLSKRTVFALSPTSDLTASWLIKLEDQSFSGKMRVCYPLRGEYLLEPLPSVFPRKINLLEFGIVELGHEYIFWSYDASSDLPVESVHRDKLAICDLGKDDDFVVLAIEFPRRFLSVYRFVYGGVHKRVAFDETRCFVDLIVFQGMFYAIDSHGTTLRIQPESMEVTQTLSSKGELCGETKRLVECEGELLLVDICTKQECCGSTNQRTGFKLFSLHRNHKVWVESTSVGDHVVFLGEKSSFSAPASTLGCRGNYIVYEWADLENANAINNRVDGGCGFGFMAEDDVVGCGFVKVFDVGSRKVEDLTKVKELMRLFWPPPSWMTETSN